MLWEVSHVKVKKNLIAHSAVKERSKRSIKRDISRFILQEFPEDRQLEASRNQKLMKSSKDAQFVGKPKGKSRKHLKQARRKY